MAASRGKSIEPQKISEPKPTVDDRPEFVPNWKAIGLKSADEGILYAIGKLIEKKKILEELGVGTGVSIVWRGKSIMI